MVNILPSRVKFYLLHAEMFISFTFCTLHNFNYFIARRGKILFHAWHAKGCRGLHHLQFVCKSMRRVNRSLGTDAGGGGSKTVLSLMISQHTSRPPAVSTRIDLPSLAKSAHLAAGSSMKFALTSGFSARACEKKTPRIFMEIVTLAFTFSRSLETHWRSGFCLQQIH